MFDPYVRILLQVGEAALQKSFLDSIRHSSWQFLVALSACDS